MQNIEVFTSAPKAHFYDQLFLNLDLSEIPKYDSKTGRRGYSNHTNNGSLYMTSLAFMPLGLPADHPFWTDEAQPWTQVKAWGGQPFPKDHRWEDTIQTKDKW